MNSEAPLYQVDELLVDTFNDGYAVLYLTSETGDVEVDLDEVEFLTYERDPRDDAGLMCLQVWQVGQLRVTMSRETAEQVSRIVNTVRRPRRNLDDLDREIVPPILASDSDPSGDEQ